MTIRSPIITPIISPIVTPLVGSEDQVFFALILRGSPPDYTSYTRIDVGYSENITGDVILVDADVPMYEYIDTAKVYRNYSGTGVLPFPPATSVTINESILTLSTTEKKPWKSPLGTFYGLSGIFNGVDSNRAVGSIVMSDYTVSSIATNITILEAADGTDIIWLDSADGLIKMTDGINTCVSPSAMVADVKTSLYFGWDDNIFWITKDDVAGTLAIFNGTFPVVGAFVRGIVSDVYQTNRSFYFNNAAELSFSFVFDGVDQVFDGVDPVVDYFI